VAALVQFVADNDLDGVDIDWEYPGPAPESVAAYTQLMTELAAALRPEGKLLTAAVAAVGENADGISADVFSQVDFLNVMAYDGPELNHSSLHYAEAALIYWKQRGLPAAQMVLGVPFYSRPVEVAYRDIVAADPEAADRDQSPYGEGIVFYNGRPTLRAKVALARERASGIMIWALAHDAPGPESLLSAIDAAVHAP
jgi:GH18 family chitinase